MRHLFLKSQSFTKYIKSAQHYAVTRHYYKKNAPEKYIMSDWL